MRKVSRKVIEEAIANAVDGEVELYEGYSGRFMYGERCFGLTGSTTAIQGVMLELAFSDIDLARELNRSSRQDNMGHDTIVYFPGYDLDDSDEDAGDNWTANG